jgi:carbonic anhydrase
MSNLDKLLQNAKDYQKRFDKPLSLGAKQKLAIVTCMDSRIKLGEIFGLELGDVEFIRNAGGRVTLDVLRSLTVACEIKELACTDVFVIHHTGACAILDTFQSAY